MADLFKGRVYDSNRLFVENENLPFDQTTKRTNMSETEISGLPKMNDSALTSSDHMLSAWKISGPMDNHNDGMCKMRDIDFRHSSWRLDSNRKTMDPELHTSYAFKTGIRYFFSNDMQMSGPPFLTITGNTSITCL